MKSNLLNASNIDGAEEDRWKKLWKSFGAIYPRLRVLMNDNININTNTRNLIQLLKNFLVTDFNLATRNKQAKGRWREEEEMINQSTKECF